jgi:hypothetical protein
LNARNLLAEHAEGAQIVSSGGGLGSKGRRCAVVDGINCADAPQDEDFAPPPLIPSSERRKRGRPRGARGGSERGIVTNNAAMASGDVARSSGAAARGSGRRGRRRGVAASARTLALAEGVLPLARHVRQRADTSDAPQRSLDDVHDAVEDEEGSGHSDGGSGSSVDVSDDDDKVLRNVEEFESSFDVSAWTQVACEGVNSARNPMPDQPLQSAGNRDHVLFGSEVPSFGRKDVDGGFIRNAIDAKVGRGCTSTLQFVKLLFTDEMLDRLVAATNKAATEHPRVKDLVRIKRSWKPVTRQSMLLWLAITVYLGVVKIQSRKTAWSKKSVFRQKWVSGHMHLEEFENILNCVNFCDHWNLSDEEFKRRNSQYVFWQVQELIKNCCTNSQAYFKMGHRISIDEACIPWKGRHKARCYNPKKPNKFHFKKFMLNDSRSGYNYNFYYYGGKGEERPEGVTASSWPVVSLLSSTTSSLHHKKHLIAVDNWFTSSKSFAWLAAHGYVAVGTVGKGKLKPATAKRPQGFPNAGIFKQSTSRTRGSYVIHKGTLLHQDKTFSCWVTAWQDRNPVHTLSTYPPVKEYCNRKIRHEGVWIEGRWPRPSVVRHYNQTMGGTDLHDQRCANFRSTVKSRRWQVRVLTDTFGSMIQNAFILFKEYHGKGRHYSSQMFIEAFLKEVTADMPQQPDDDEPVEQPERKLCEHKRNYWVHGKGSEARLTGRDHWPVDARNCWPTVHPRTGATLDLRRYCMWNPRLCGRTYTYCSSCMVSLCLYHFEMFHTRDGSAFPK